MALTQIKDGGGESEDYVKELLQAEYKLLCVGDGLKKQFDKWAEECNVNIPRKCMKHAKSEHLT